FLMIFFQFGIKFNEYICYIYKKNEAANFRNLLRIIKITCLIIAAVLFIEYIDYFIAVLNYPNNIYLDEGFSARISLSFIANGIKFTDFNTYPYILTIYGFFYELVCAPLFYFMEPTVNCGRIISF